MLAYTSNELLVGGHSNAKQQTIQKINELPDK